MPGPRRHLLAVVAAVVAGCTTCGACEEEDADRGLDLGGGEPDKPRVVEIVLPEAPVESPQKQPLAPSKPSIRRVIQHLDAIAEQERVQGLFLRLGPFGGGWGRARDVADALARIREAGKPVHCHFQRADNVSYALLAEACDRISMTPAGHLNLVGPAAHVFYARSLLERLGLHAELLQVGRYKGAADPFTRNEMPPETREALGAILDELHGSLVDSLEKGRDLSPERVRDIIDAGPYGAVRAREAELVDDVGFDDEAREHARQAGDVPKVRRVDLIPRREPMGLGDLLKALAGEPPRREREGKRLALVRLHGNIVDAERKGLDGARSGPFVRALRRMAEDDDIEAVVLRINSPGGSALASDRMWHAVRRAAKHKPVIASIGDMAASGGYYIASAATEILAHDTSLVGSIGVVGGKIEGSDLIDRAGVNPVILQRGEHAAWSTPVRGFSESERERLKRMLRSTYRRFIRRVATGRELPEKEVEQAAQGRLLTGHRGRQLGLVDEPGGMASALDRAREAGGLPDDAPVEVWPPETSLLDVVAKRFGGEASGVARAWLRRFGGELGALSEVAALSTLLLEREQVSVALPYILHIE